MTPPKGAASDADGARASPDRAILAASSTQGRSNRRDNRRMPEIDPTLIARHVAWMAFALGAAFVAIAQRTHFCTMGAVADIATMGDWTRMRMWVLAIAVAIVGF